MDRARAKLGDKVIIPAVVEKIEYVTMGETSYKVEPITTWFDADEIEALRESTDKYINATTTDCISRKDAIEAVTRAIRDKFSLADWYEQLLETGEEIEALIESLPPVAPKPVADCITRQQVTDEIKRWRGYLDEDMIERINTRMKMLPPATPTERTGEWKHTMTYYPYCSECEWMPEEDEMTHGYYNYCPTCGANMGGKEEKNSDL